MAVDKHNYEKYNALMQGLNVMHKGYNLKYVMSSDFVFYAYKLRTFIIDRPFFMKCLFYTHDITEFERALHLNKVLFTISLPGNDHLQLVKNVMKEVPNAFFLQDNYPLKKKISLSNIITSFSTFFFKYSNTKIEFRQRLYFALQICFFKNIIDELEKLPRKVAIKNYVASFSGNKESLYCTFFQKRNVKTFCLQHGLHSAKSDYRCYIPADIVSLENLNADHMLGWGDYTRDALLNEGFESSKYILAGSPKYSYVKKIIVRNTNFTNCIFCLSRDIYSIQNHQLLYIAKQFQSSGNKVYIKFHPRSNEQIYSEKIEKFELRMLPKTMTISETKAAFDPDFVVVFNSTVYYEYYLNNVIAFRYSEGANDIPFGLDDEFKDYEGLLQIIKRFKNIRNEELNIEVNEMVNRFSALGVNNYAKILN